MTRTSFSFFVPGLAKPGGSKRGFHNRHTGKIIILDDCKENKNWRSDVKSHFLKAECQNLGREPIILFLEFHFPRPKSHYGTGRNQDRLKPGAPVYHAQKPDTTKLVRAVEDALTGLGWHDDAQICAQHCEKSWCSEGQVPGCRITAIWASTLEGGS
jgi:Holliday junction resolvase RusA-like endonuclease